MANGLSPLLAFAAGALTILSPCVLPLVPIVIGSAAQRHKWGPFALALGLVASFTLVGFAVAVLGASSGFDGEIVRQTGAVILLLVGALLLVPQAQDLLARAAAPLAGWAGRRQSGLERFGLAGQAGIGVLLGLVWSPCVGPTLGAATVLAAQGQNLAEVALVMAAFGVGIATMLLLIATATRGFLSRWRGRLMSTGQGGKRVLGALLILVALLILTGGDRMFEGLVVSLSPDWLTDLTTAL
ncbi:cytochrome c biogenesis CcdA family protein [Sphingomonas sp. AR_OL41]|uniref:cytochrome c biogenesis CcdA family protein n=1 Tax=Sphingomonas sp. AR_OL41 TaxID=3042729 RepID=UPI0024807E25|nr:cytochrome c biogenesis CcdA family protein [Sphingomonas sp. AR_OL41]MDH7971590.1 cytochrome c biogenesis CcdA family protein [Sphingomonas sp. AR_OL41]